MCFRVEFYFTFSTGASRVVCVTKKQLEVGLLGAESHQNKLINKQNTQKWDTKTLHQIACNQNKKNQIRIFSPPKWVIFISWSKTFSFLHRDWLITQTFIMLTSLLHQTSTWKGSVKKKEKKNLLLAHSDIVWRCQSWGWSLFGNRFSAPSSLANVISFTKKTNWACGRGHSLPWRWYEELDLFYFVP